MADPIKTNIDVFKQANSSVNGTIGFPDKAANRALGYANDVKDAKRDALNTLDKAKNANKQVIDIGKRIQAAFGFASSNKSNKLIKAGFADAISNAEVFIRDSRTSFEELVLDYRPKGISLKFDYMGFVQEQSNVFAPPPMVSFRKSKKVDVTELDEGDVVELYGKSINRTWDISIQGILVDMDNHSYPGTKVRKLVELFHVDDQWNVTSSLFQDHNITSIYFTDIDSAGVQGFEDTWAFTLTAKSIIPVEFFLKKQNLQ